MVPYNENEKCSSGNIVNQALTHFICIDNPNIMLAQQSKVERGETRDKSR